MSETQATTVTVNISGSADLSEDLALDDKVVLIVTGTVAAVGEKSTASSGHKEVRTVRASDMVLAPEDLREQLATLVAQAADERAGVQSIDFPNDDGDGDGAIDGDDH